MSKRKTSQDEAPRQNRVRAAGEIVGAIGDEFEQEEGRSIESHGDGTFTVLGATPIADFNAASAAAVACAYARATGTVPTVFPINHGTVSFVPKAFVPSVPESPTDGLQYTY